MSGTSSSVSSPTTRPTLAGSLSKTAAMLIPCSAKIGELAIAAPSADEHRGRLERPAQGIRSSARTPDDDVPLTDELVDALERRDGGPAATRPRGRARGLVGLALYARLLAMADRVRTNHEAIRIRIGNGELLQPQPHDRRLRLSRRSATTTCSGPDVYITDSNHRSRREDAPKELPME